jgi:signal transduction histidine kinase
LIGAVVFLCFLMGAILFGQTWIYQEHQSGTKEVLENGVHLVSFIALHSIDDLEGEKRNFFLKTLAEQMLSKGLLYCVIHGPSGDPLISLMPKGLMQKIPNHIQVAALGAIGLNKQFFKIPDYEEEVYEFSKPVFEQGQRTGTVRVGLKVPNAPLISTERIKLLAMLAFLVFATATFLYYAVVLSLRPLKAVAVDFKDGHIEPSLSDYSNPRDAGIASFLNDIETSIEQLKVHLTNAEKENLELSTKLGVTHFEKKQITGTLDSIDFGVMITDIHDNISYANKFMLNLLKRKEKEVIDNPLTTIFKSEEINSFLSRQESISNNLGDNAVDLRLPELAPGRAFRLSISLLKDREGSIIGRMVTINDMTKENEAQEAKHSFIAHVAHELKTPLTTIKSYNEMLMEGEIDEVETQKQFFNTINEEADRLTGLINNLLNITKIEMGSLTLNRGLVKTDGLIEDTINAVETAAQSKGIVLEKSVPDTDPSLVGDKELLKIAIINILSNAVKYTPEKGTVTLSLSDEEDVIIFNVVDTGFGISNEDLPHIFETSFRSRAKNIAEQSGSGFGLAIASEIIRLHDGVIEVESQQGEGSHFTVKIPKEAYYLGNQ